MDPRILQMIMALISRNSQTQPFGGGSGQSPQWGQQSPYGAPSNQPGMPMGGQMGQPPRMGQLPQRQSGPRLKGVPGGMMGGQMMDGGSPYLGQPNNISTGQPPMQQMIDYRNGARMQPNYTQQATGGAPGNPFRVR